MASSSEENEHSLNRGGCEPKPNRIFESKELIARLSAHCPPAEAVLEHLGTSGSHMTGTAIWSASFHRTQKKA